MARRTAKSKQVENLTHDESVRLNIPTAEYQTQPSDDAVAAIRAVYERLNRDLDPQLVWRGKDIADWADLVVSAPPLYIQEKVHPKALVEDLRRLTHERSVEQAAADAGFQIELFSDFNGLPAGDAKTEFYQHQMNWSNRMILGDSLQVMASLAEREGLRGQVQCIYIDPPYGIKFNSNFQWSTTSRDVRDGRADHITREPEQVRAFRDTWRDGIHSYLTYLRDRLTAARDLLTESGSVFVQIGDENVHRVRSLMDEVFGADNYVGHIRFRRGGFQTSAHLPETYDSILWWAKDKTELKFRRLFLQGDRARAFQGQTLYAEYPNGTHATIERSQITDKIAKVFRHRALYSATGSESSRFDVYHEGSVYLPSGNRGWSTNQIGMQRASIANRLFPVGRTLERKMYFEDSPFQFLTTEWADTVSSGYGEQKLYVVQTQAIAPQRCILMATDPGDLILDPTCGSGTTAYVAEQWGRRWITIDTSRVALALARARLMGARYPYYILSDSPEGQQKEAELSHAESSDASTYGDVRRGFVYERVPHITLRSIANNAEIDVIYEQRQPAVKAALADLNSALRADPPEPFEVSVGGRKGERIDFTRSPESTVPLPSGEEAPASGLLEWEVPRERPDDWPADTAEPHERFWQARLERQQAIDESIAAQADFEYLYDKPYEDNAKVRVAGPFTVESISPHRYLALDADDELIDPVAEARGNGEAPQDFVSLILDNLRTAGVQQAHKTDRISFASLLPWPGKYVCAEGTYIERSTAPPSDGEATRRDTDSIAEGAEEGSASLEPAGLREQSTPPLPQRSHPETQPAADDADQTRQRRLERGREGGDPLPPVSPADDANGDADGSKHAPAGAQGETRKAAILVGPEFGTVSRSDLAAASKEARDAGFDVLIACAFSYDSHASELTKLGPLQVLKARMNADLHMASELKSTGTGNLFVIFGEPDIELLPVPAADDGSDDGSDEAGADETSTAQYCVRLKGIDVFDPTTGDIRSDEPDTIACWFVDTDYNHESFFVRHAYFLGASDPYKSLKTTLKAEIDEDAWATLRSDTSRPFPAPESGHIAVKVINHLGDEVMKVFRVPDQP